MSNENSKNLSVASTRGTMPLRDIRTSQGPRRDGERLSRTYSYDDRSYFYVAPINLGPRKTRIK
jgi:hypothetical protein